MVSISITQEAKNELSKFFKLTSKLNRRLEMFSDFLDEVWHEMLKDKASYESFCVENSGYLIEHIDSIIPGASGYGEISWIKDYEALYGRLTKEWFMGSDGNFDQVLYSNYLNNGNILAAWKCNPAIVKK